MQNIDKSKERRKDVEESLKYWADKKAHFSKTKNASGIKVSDLLIDKYLDKLNILIIHEDENNKK